MPLALLLALQAAAPAAPPPAAAAGIVDSDFDLARFQPPSLGLPGRGCARADPSAIIVCGRRSAGAYPLAEMALIFEPRHMVAQTRLGGNFIGDVHVESVPMDRGQVSNRVMVGVRLPF
ncbi:MAG: hypothetical protein JO276_11550 [Sphingomonadaceae bacterium]|nr:hypothetical protein [Sphingomonadaceae bacterium]